MPPKGTIIEVEGQLRFSFDERWNAFKWDEAPEFIDGLQRHKGTQGVDIIAALDGRQLWLIEVKDPRAHRIEFKRKASDLHSVVAGKARDTLAGAFWSVDRLGNGRISKYLRVLLAETEKVGVALWWEGVDKVFVSMMQVEIERQLKWMNPKVLVTSRSLFGAREQTILQGVQVSSLRGAPARR